MRIYLAVLLLLPMAACATQPIVVHPPIDVNPAIVAVQAENCLVPGTAAEVQAKCLDSKERKVTALTQAAKDQYVLYMTLVVQRLSEQGKNWKDALLQALATGSSLAALGLSATK